VLWLLLGLPPVAATAQTADANLLTTNSPFVLYLQNPPWIKEMVYVESQPWVAHYPPPQIEKKGWDNITNRAAIQPSGIFREMLSDSSGGPARLPTERIVQGVSDHYYWNAHKDQPGTSISSLAFSSRRAEEGASEKNINFINYQRTKATIERIRYFGLPPLQTNSFKLAGHDQFEAQTADGYELDGKILTAANDHPLNLTYTLGGSTNDVFAIKYAYKAGEDLPAYFERTELRNGHLYGSPHTNWIESVNFGIDTTVTNGYSPSVFFTNMAIFTHMIMESNGQRYVIGESGDKKLIDETPPPQLPGQNGHGRGGVIVAFIIIFLAAGGVAVWRLKQRSQES
jgi:hypothetical protein